MHPELATDYNYTGHENVTVGIDTSANVIIDESFNMDYAAAVDYSVAGMGTGVYNVDIPTHDHSDLHQHLHDLVQKVDELNRKVDHLLEHAHQPLYGTVNIEPPAKVGAGYTV